MNYAQSLENAQPYFKDSDYVDIKSIEGDVTFREFLAGALSYYPFWIKFLYGVRAIFVRFLGMKQPRYPGGVPHITPEEISFEAGANGTIFTVKEGVENHYWIAAATDKHLTADIIIAREALANGKSRFHVCTVVHYHNWAGPVYFTFVRPFHHIVAWRMLKAGVNYGK